MRGFTQISLTLRQLPAYHPGRFFGVANWRDSGVTAPSVAVGVVFHLRVG